MNVINFFYDLKTFVKNLAGDSRIPSFDKKVILVLLLCLLSPFDFIPDWIPMMGLLDDFIILSLLFEYFFKTLDNRIFLSHYPWSMKSFNRLQRIAHFFSFFAPNFITSNLWKYQRDIY